MKTPQKPKRAPDLVFDPKTPTPVIVEAMLKLMEKQGVKFKKKAKK